MIDKKEMERDLTELVRKIVDCTSKYPILGLSTFQPDYIHVRDVRVCTTDIRESESSIPDYPIRYDAMLGSVHLYSLHKKGA